MTYEELEKENSELKQQVENLKKAYEIAHDLAVSYASRTEELEKNTRTLIKKRVCYDKNS